MFSEALNSEDHFNSLMELAQDPNNLPSCPPSPTLSPAPAPPTTTTVSFDADIQREGNPNKHSIVIEDDFSTDMQPPPPKKNRISTTTTTTTPFHRIPCKARGMSKKHNSDTAFIDVPIDAPHGLLLCCSNRECVSSGRKFRYCKVCAVPVAKRNFPKRHGHGLIERADELKEIDYAATFINPSATVTTSIPSSEYTTTTANSCYPCELVPSSPQQQHQQSTAVLVDEKLYRYAADGLLLDQELPVLPTTTCATPIAPPSSTPALLELSPAERDWLTLLKERPNLEEDTEMSCWVDKIMNFLPIVNKNDNVTTIQQQQDDEQPPPIIAVPTPAAVPSSNVTTV